MEVAENGLAAFCKIQIQMPDLVISNLRMPKKSQVSLVWVTAGDGQVKLTCTSCLRSFPRETCEGTTPAKHTDCIFLRSPARRTTRRHRSERRRALLSKQVQFSHGCPGIAVDLGDLAQAHILRLNGIEGHSFPTLVAEGRHQCAARN